MSLQVKENKPDGWPDSISFEDFKGVSFAKKEEATQIIEPLFDILRQSGARYLF